MSSLVPKEPPPRLDHDAHLLRLSLEIGGAEQAATAAGIIDGAGYLAGALAGAALGRVLDVGGHSLGFSILAGITFVSALIALALRPAAAPRSASHV